MAEDLFEIAIIVAFASYPFAMGFAASYFYRRARNHFYCWNSACILAMIGVVTALWLYYPEPKIPHVAVIAGLVLIAGMTVTGAFIGTLLDLRGERLKHTSSQ